VEVEISFTYKERAFGVLRHTGNRDHAQADVPTGNESCIGLVSQVVRAKIIIPHITQQTADAGTFTIKISNIELFTRTDQGAPAAKVDNLHRRTIESPIIYGINEIRVTHIDRVLQFSFQTVLRINESLITYRAIEVPIIMQDIRRYFLPDVRINGRYEYGGGGKTIEYPLTKTFFVLRKTIIHPQSEWKRDAVFGATEQGVIGSFGKGGFHFFHSSLAYLGIRAVLYNHRLLTGVEHFAFGQVLSSGAGCQKQGCKEYIYKFLHFILLCIKNLCMCLPPPPSGTPPPGRRRTENDSRGIILLLFLLHYSLTGSTFFFLLNMNSSLRRSILRRSTRPTPVSVISPSSTLS
jgi:hypothetical protein